jgi:hypothetical protein
MDARAARRYEVTYKSRGWRAWGMTNPQGATMTQFDSTLNIATGGTLTRKTGGSGKVLVKDLSTKKVVWQQPIEGQQVRAFMDAMAEDLERMTVAEFQDKWGIAAPT